MKKTITVGLKSFARRWPMPLTPMMMVSTAEKNMPTARLEAMLSNGVPRGFADGDGQNGAPP
jgi:hypothetical protein